MLAAFVLALATLVALPGTASADESWWRGPAPTQASISAAQGPFATSSTTVSSFSTPGFGAATIYYPTTTTAGTFGGVAISPGYTATQSSIAWLGPRIASQGFVVITFDTNSRYDQPASRGDQLLAALDYLTTSSPVRARVDADRLAVMGHSMGGGGTLEAAKDRPSLDAAIPLTGWNTDKTWPEVTTPTLVIGAESDSVAPVSSHSIPFYNSLTNAQERAYLELNGASHFAPNSPNTTIASTSIAWLKRWVDTDTRYSQFLCPGPSVTLTGAVSDYRSTCPV
ncbi:alpha/beta hydrolase family protein [Modestobacter versicolor]|uniref:Putative dienelactone hydrolase n=1 Tax=Modestobacter versicolor TaxID=429133 RepID=A0A839Y401_9ACTN|nr:dienelactone hydrolase family protein [Modestobacter versicolor]MBB3676102.1 putative dienelactone hydrolase [Modestobacter versicolor]